MKPRLDDLRILVAVVDAGGFRPAAQRLGLPASSVSDTVRRLEDQLGLRLLERNTRGIMPTDAGRVLLEGVRPALGLVERTVGALLGAAEQPSGRLRLTVPEIVARYVLPDLVAPFLLAAPGVAVEVSVDNAVLDIVDAGFDAAIRYDERVARNMVAVPIGPAVQRYVAAAAPAYLERHGIPRDPPQLSGHRLIGHRLPTGAMVEWEFARGRRRHRVMPDGALVTASIDLRLAAAVAGAGILYTFDEVLRPALAAGRLVAILEDWSIGFPGPVLCYHGDRHVPPPLRALLDFLGANR